MENRPSTQRYFAFKRRDIFVDPKKAKVEAVVIEANGQSLNYQHRRGHYHPGQLFSFTLLGLNKDEGTFTVSFMDVNEMDRSATFNLSSVDKLTIQCQSARILVKSPSNRF